MAICFPSNFRPEIDIAIHARHGLPAILTHFEPLTFTWLVTALIHSQQELHLCCDHMQL